MGTIKTLRLMLLVSNVIILSYAAAHSSEDNEITIEDEPLDIEEEVDKVQYSSRSQKERLSRILFPYPLESSEKATDSGTSHTEPTRDVDTKKITTYPFFLNENEKNDTAKEPETPSNAADRRARFFISYPQSPIIDMMMQTAAVNYRQQNANDPFDFLRDSYPLPKGYSKPLDEYDYVIVGAGSGGSVLAARLTEDKPRAMVLLLEAGKPEMLLTDVPALAPYFQRTDYAWQYVTEPQPGVCMGLERQRCFWPRGKAVGGTSVINFMLYTRGRPQDWDRIAADGNYGWSYNEVLKYFMKSERCELKRYKDESYRGSRGELTVENVPFRTGLMEAFLEAGRSFGHPTVDYNAPDGFGFGYTQSTTSKGHRLSAAKAFLHPHKRRRNLHILPEARASKVVIEPETKRAYAVEYFHNGIKYKVRSRREVILSAGPIASPQLLMLSGVGPQDHLQKFGIPVIKNLNVGKSLYDHIAFPGVIFKLNTSNASILEHKAATLPNLVQWMQYGDGLLSTPALIEGIGYIKTSASNDPEQVPDIELVSFGGSITSDSGGAFRKGITITDKTYYSAFGSINGVDTWSAVPLLLHPKSKGYLELKDTNPFSHPKLFGNYLIDSHDVRTFIEAIKYIIKLGESQPFQKYGPKLHLAEYPTCVIHPMGSDAYWECALRTITTTVHHQIATCRMGPPNDPDAVVDPELRVYGIDGLRVVDSSVIPRTISAHTNAPAIMIGEKAADLIKETWSNVVA
ncbi:Glucose dehydrogenase [Eumeta japonica]|uniref:Glucose dehydrogenase n=1 Tax=Eumeta variegata TaxID=151549 RepID=A0A4C1XZC8_EUMVA|nr:Glucose dehydrogenase [Eumeta japonica]